MLAFDTNILIYALNPYCEQHARAREWLTSQKHRDDVVVCELVLVEAYVLLRTPAVFPKPSTASAAVATLRPFRRHPRWRLVDWPEAPDVADRLWTFAERNDWSRRRIFDARLALALRHHGVTRFATSNIGHFDGFDFKEVFDPTYSP